MKNKIPESAIKVGSHGFVKLDMWMGEDETIVDKAKISYNDHQKDMEQEVLMALSEIEGKEIRHVTNQPEIEAIPTDEGTVEHKYNGNGFIKVHYMDGTSRLETWKDNKEPELILRGRELYEKQNNDRRRLIRYLMRHRHTSPFEMVVFTFLVKSPIHVARQWFRHRMASYNEYSTRYKEAIDECEITPPEEWRLQSTDNKQGSGDYINEWGEDDGIPKGYDNPVPMIDSEAWPRFLEQHPTPGHYLSQDEKAALELNRKVYEKRLKFGVAREQARKDLPLSTYTEFFVKMDLHNLFHFLSLRMHPHAQKEIREFAHAIYDLIKPVVPEACQAFEDYRLNAVTFSVDEMSILKGLLATTNPSKDLCGPDLSGREWKEFIAKLN